MRNYAKNIYLSRMTDRQKRMSLDKKMTNIRGPNKIAGQESRTALYRGKVTKVGSFAITTFRIGDLLV